MLQIKIYQRSVKRELPRPVAPDEPLKAIDEAATETSVTEAENEATVQAMKSSYNCCGVW